MELSKNEEDYLKAMFHITVEQEMEVAGTNQLAEYIGVSPASVNGMVKRLKAKELVHAERYKKLQLTDSGAQIAIQLIRKHRLWETFLYRHLDFSWDEVHEVAEQLEHIKSPKLIQRLDVFLGNPKFDPHGDVIPNEAGEFQREMKLRLSEIEEGETCRVVSVKDASVAFLQMVSKVGIGLQTKIRVLEHQEFDGSLLLAIDGKDAQVSKKFAENVFVSKDLPA